MALRRRIGLVALGALLLLCAAFGVVTWWRDAREQSRYDALLLRAQSIAWERVQADSLATTDATVRKLVADPAWASAWGKRDRLALGRLLEAAAAQAPGLRLDVYDSRAALAATTAPGLDPAPLALVGWIRAVDVQATPAIQGLSQVEASRYAWVTLRPFEGGVVAAGLDVAQRLPELAASLGGAVSLVNMRGHEVAGEPAGQLRDAGIAVPLRTRRAAIERVGMRDWQVVSQPLLNPDGRETGVLVWQQDVAHAVRDRQRTDTALTLSLALAVLALAAGVGFYLRQVTEPLGRWVGVLQALSRGSTDAAPDEGEDEAEGESGDMARGILAIRAELLNLQTLRDERVRTRRQQERLIRDQLRTLADSLDPGSREEILAALGDSRAEVAEPLPADAESDNQLADLAGILGRMSGLVTNQQTQLLKLLRDLQAAMATQTLFASLQQELEIARQMQLSILPRSRPDAVEVDVHATMIPAKEIGGDFYDYFMVDAEHLAVVVADVSGKGVPAAFFMAISRTLLKSNALFLHAPGATIAALNDQLCADNEQMMFVTVFYGVLHLPTGRFSYVNAGHNPPARISDGQASFFPRGQNMALAVLEGQAYIEGNTVLARGETLLLYTDGVTEATDREGALMGEEALLTLAAQHVGSGPELPQAVVRAVHAFENGVAQSDDVTVVALTYRGTA